MDNLPQACLIPMKILQGLDDARRPRVGLLLSIAAVFAAVIFMIDALTDIDIAVAVLYVVVVLLTASTGNRRLTVRVGLACLVATVIAYLMGRGAFISGPATARASIALLAIAVTLMLALRDQRNAAALREQVHLLESARDALARSEAFLSEAQHLSHTGSFGFRFPDEVTFLSAEARRIVGVGPDDSLSLRALLARVHGDDRERCEAAYAAARTHHVALDVQHRITLPDGTERTVHLMARPFVNTTEFVGALMDKTESKRTQDALHRSLAELAHVTRVTTLGQLAGSIAHEVNQPIAAVITNGDAALRWLNRPAPDHKEAMQAIQNMIRDAKRSAEVVRRIRVLAQKRDPQHIVVDVNALVIESVELIARELEDHGATLLLDLAVGHPIVCGDRVQLQQVLINLAMNGLQAMDGGARRQLLIRTQQADPTQADVLQREALGLGSETPSVIVTVQDWGGGISQVHQQQMFSPFFTTKSDGMGMGLSICRSIVEAHGGRIGVSSPVVASSEGGSGAGVGSSIEFVLPAYVARADETEAAGTSCSYLAGDASVRHFPAQPPGTRLF